MRSIRRDRYRDRTVVLVITHLSTLRQRGFKLNLSKRDSEHFLGLQGRKPHSTAGSGRFLLSPAT